jgi:uncharacterized small protein (TIGR04563 family)
MRWIPRWDEVPLKPLDDFSPDVDHCRSTAERGGDLPPSQILRRPALANDKDSMSNLRSESSKTDKRKQSLYFPESMLQEIKEEAARLDRSLSWVVQRAWKISRLEIKKLPSVNEVDGGEDDDEA